MPPATHTLRVQTSARPVTVTLYTRGRTPAAWHYYFSFHGRHRDSTGHTDLKAAQAIARQAVLDAVHQAPTTSALPLDRAIAAYLAGRWPGLDTTQPRHALPRRYAEADEKLNRFAAWSATLPAPRSPVDLTRLALDATTALAQAFLDHRKATCAAQTVRNDARMLSAFWAYLIRTPDLKALLPYRDNPVDARFLTLDPVPRRPRPPAPAAAIAALLEHGRASPAWPAILLCLTAGFRPIGASRIRWQDADLAAGVLTVEEKNRRRTVRIPRWVAKELRAWRRLHPEAETLVPKERHRTHWALKQLRQKLGLSADVTLQSLRRSFIGRCMDAGIDVNVVAGQAGNSPAVIARHYKDLGTLSAQKITDLMEHLPQTLPQTKGRKAISR